MKLGQCMSASPKHLLVHENCFKEKSLHLTRDELTLIVKMTCENWAREDYFKKTNRNNNNKTNKTKQQQQQQKKKKKTHPTCSYFKKCEF